MTELTDLSETDASNTTITTANIAEGCPPSGINNAIRNTLGLIRRAFKASIFRIRDTTDQTKLLALDLSGFTTGTTRTVAVPNASGTMAFNELATAQVASGTSVDFTGIPLWVKEITVSFYTVSTSGTSFFLVQIGDAGGIETSGYTGSCTSIVTSVPPVNTGVSTGFALRTGVSASSYSGSMTLTKHDATGGDYWVASGLVSDVGGDLAMGSGGKVLTALLDRVRITTVNGTDTFDGGSLNVLYK